MADTVKVGDKVRVRGAAAVGEVVRVEGGFVNVRYDHRPGVSTLGDYPVGHVEVVTSSPLTPALSPLMGEGEKTTKLKATTKDILRDNAL